MIDYNECRPHESLDNKTPMEYRQKEGMLIVQKGKVTICRIDCQG